MTADTPSSRPMRIVLVCTGNTCRSPMAEALVRQALAVRNISDVEVFSAGTGAWEGAPASEGAYLVALEHGLDLSEHRARLLTAEVIAGSDLILTMAAHHRARVLELVPEAPAHVLGEYARAPGAGAEVADPFGHELSEYRHAFEELSILTSALADRLSAERPDAGR